MNKAIIGGTGVGSLPNLQGPFQTETAFGVVQTYRFRIGEEEILFLPRHGSGHTTPPHAINYRAQMAALKQEGITYVYALATSGSMDPSISEGSIVVIEDFLDYTTSRIKTFFDGSNQKVAHTDMSDPYCKYLRTLFGEAAKQQGVPFYTGGVYVCTEGPRFEGRAEIAMLRKAGGTLVGMTGIPEVFLAKELGLCYCAIGLISNMACGIKNENLAHIDHGKRISEAKEAVMQVITNIFSTKTLDQDHCDCAKAVLYL
ncbi:MAG: S-methyl-5'-thioinosine phosphorylase [Sphaerochaeta associata]|uniref:S-methyl-5'-thioinosine phosphorylase n=1 Tax=Sphaerochaeta associata TaxID=1129264 RepID=UPI002B1EF004|nr:S-methyl-5'-thioinosine phosphorylase [Sphaerochaeta associata]MEA5027301.1 S-methyl-5'-thioinosine phosphorylase [Sphaerochaeta associata]